MSKNILVEITLTSKAAENMLAEYLQDMDWNGIYGPKDVKLALEDFIEFTWGEK